MMTVVFVIAGLVVGKGSVFQGGATLTPPEGATTYEVDHGVTVDVGYACAEVDGAPVFTPPAPTTPPPDPCEWLIDLGPYFDRFGASAQAVLRSADPDVSAIVKNVMARKWVDLRRPDVAAGIDALIALGVAGVTHDLKTSILTTPVTNDENIALRKLYFS